MLFFICVLFKKCEDANGTEDTNGNCRCKRGFFGKNPFVGEGCWICQPECGSLMTCIYPGICKCKFGLMEIEKNTCEPPTPRILNISFNGRALIVFDSINDFFPFEAFCRINRNIYSAVIINHSVLSCMESMKQEHGFVSISFDGFKWSEDYLIPNSSNEVVTIIRTSYHIRQFRIRFFKKYIIYFLIGSIISSIFFDLIFAFRLPKRALSNY